MKNSKLLIAVVALVAMVPAFASGPDFHPDVTVSGKSLDGWHTMGDAKWRAENGTIVGTPGATGAGGWLVFDKSYQDLYYYMQYRCADGCATGLLMRAEKTPDGGMKGVFVSLGGPLSVGDTSLGNGGAYDVVLDAQGKIVSATQEPRGSGFDRIITPWPPKPPAPRPGAAAGGGNRGGAGGGGGGGRGGQGGGVQLPVTRIDARYKPGDWNSFGVHFDANAFRSALNGTGGTPWYLLSCRGLRAYRALCRWDRQRGVQGHRRGRPRPAGASSPEETSPDFRKQTLSDFYYGWGQAASDVNHDGHLDIISGAFVYYGPDFTKFREIFRGEATDPTNDYNMEAHEEVCARLHRGRMGRPDYRQVRRRSTLRLPVRQSPRGENHTWAEVPGRRFRVRAS